MSYLNFEDILTNVCSGEVYDNIVLPSLSELEALFTMDTNIREGSSIKDTDTMTETAGGGAYTRSDGDPAPLAMTWAQPTWVKTYYHEKAYIRGEDIKEMLGSQAGAVASLQRATNRAVAQLMNTHVWGGIFTQMALDIDSSGDYSDAPITRSTPLQSYEEGTTATMTLAYWRGMWQAIDLRAEIDWDNYIGIFAPAVWKTFYPLADALITKTSMDPKMSDVLAAGYQKIDSVDGIRVMKKYGVPAGFVYLADRRDVLIQNHSPLELTFQGPEHLNEDAYAVTARIGINLRVQRPRFQGKLFGKS
jgi:hypothetical protein